MDTDFSRILDYFDTCIEYWERKGESRLLAIAHTIWYDCIEVWNIDNSWTDEKLRFVRLFYPHYQPGDTTDSPDALLLDELDGRR